MLDSAKELTIREALGTKVAVITATAFVRRPVIDSKHDWAELLGKQNVDDELEVKCCTVDLLQFTDSDQEGCDDDPVVTLTYQVHLFHQYKEARSDDSNSTDDFAAAVLDLRNKFLEKNRDVAGVADAEYLPLTQSGFIILGTDPLTGSEGHFVDLIAKVEVR
jgi:hypothetical protein